MKKTLLILTLILAMTNVFAQSDYEKRIMALGYDPTITKDWSDSTAITIDEPKCAYINIYGINKLSASKTTILKAWMEFYDGAGNYFKKRILESAQGNSSVYFYDKKNFKIDICEDEWLGEETPDITIGEWVPQDSYHFKAYHNDTYKAYASVAYQVYDQMILDRGPHKGRAWARSGIDSPDFDERAVCHPLGFPTAVYLNGKFHGIWIWSLKKHRKNMNLSKNTPEMIHLDGQLSNQSIFAGTIKWKSVEIKSPKTLYTMDGAEYVDDKRGELIDETSEFFNLPDDTKKVKKYKENSALVKKYIQQVSKYRGDLFTMAKTYDKAAMREEVEKRFDVSSLIDYYLFSQFTNNYDGIEGNWQWITYDGQKWFTLPYDVDCVFGLENFARFIYPPEVCSYRGNFGYEGNMYWAKLYYLDEVKEQYAKLRRKKIFSKENVLSMVQKWIQRIGEENYALEKVAWPNSPCLSETILNKNWVGLETWTNYSTYPAYDDNTTYQTGDIVRWKYKLWKATGTTKGVVPAAQTGYTDTLERLGSWIDGRLVYLDNKFGYIPQILVGDVNDDGELSVVDIMLLVDIILNGRTDVDTKVADVNGDGAVNVADVMGLADIILNNAL